MGTQLNKQFETYFRKKEKSQSQNKLFKKRMITNIEIRSVILIISW